MKIFSLLIALMSTIAIYAQLTDDFSDGDFLHQPTWTGDTAFFQVSSAFELQSNGARQTDTIYLSTPSSAISNASWTFDIRMAFNPSGSNYAKIYLVSDRDSLSGSLNGYFVKVGGTDDEVSLYRQDGKKEIELIDGPDDVTDSSTVRLRIRVLRDSTGIWMLQRDTSGQAHFVMDGSVSDLTYLSSHYFGVLCRFTSTRSDKFFFDHFEVYGGPVKDRDSPVLDSVKVQTQRAVRLFFNEALDSMHAVNTKNYRVEPGIAVTSATLDAAHHQSVLLTLDPVLQNGHRYTLLVDHITDTAGNTIDSTTQDFIYSPPEHFSFRSLIINELFPDPSPSNGLPEAEYIELYHPGSGYMELDGWKLADRTDTVTLPYVVMGSGEYLIICDSSDTQLFLSYGKVLGVPDLPALNNAEDDISLISPLGELIDQVNYHDDWHEERSKSEGGWSLELIDPNLLCLSPENWNSSIAPKGGTPGVPNSILEFIEPQTIGIEHVMTLSPQLLQVSLDTPVDTSMPDLNTFSLTGGLKVTQISALNTATFTLEVNPSFSIFEAYRLSFNVTDCYGVTSSFSNIPIHVTTTPEFNDLVINEILFNPPTGGTDFVELFNRSDKVLRGDHLFLANIRGDSISSVTPIFTSPFLIMPGDYLVLTENVTHTLHNYPGARQENLYKVSSLPSFPDDEGHVILLDSNLQVIDRVDYHQDQHFALISEEDGVSLERVHPDLPSSDELNWHSAGSAHDYATPGYLNSQFTPLVSPAENVLLNPPIFSPDNDGYQDFLNIHYEMDGPGHVCSIYIFDDAGVMVNHLVQNELMSTTGRYSWDGLNDEGERADMGIYIVYIEVFDLNGNISRKKIPAVLAKRL